MVVTTYNIRSDHYFDIISDVLLFSNVVPHELETCTLTNPGIDRTLVQLADFRDQLKHSRVSDSDTKMIQPGVHL